VHTNFVKVPLESYRFKFNGKESDDEIYGIGAFQDYGMRMYDTRVCRFISVDPITKKYPELTPYQFASNTPIWGIDLDGLEVYYMNDGTRAGQVGKSTEVRIVNSEYNLTQAKKAIAMQGRGEIKNWDDWNTAYSTGTGFEEAGFKRMAGVLYAEGASTWKESAGIYSVLENRAALNGTTTSQEATVGKGVYGASESNKINQKTANQSMVKNAYKGLISGILSNDDFSNGAFWWDGKDFNGDNNKHGGYDSRYSPGYDFTNSSRDLWSQGDNKKSGSTNYGSWDYKYESTGAEGNTTYSRLTSKWRDAQYSGSKKADGLGR
jgi:RHS repeat-associated protein